MFSPNNWCNISIFTYNVQNSKLKSRTETAGCHFAQTALWDNFIKVSNMTCFTIQMHKAHFSVSGSWITWFLLFVDVTHFRHFIKTYMTSLHETLLQIKKVGHIINEKNGLYIFAMHYSDTYPLLLPVYCVELSLLTCLSVFLLVKKKHILFSHLDVLLYFSRAGIAQSI
jgi:hypothetical protein